MPDRLVYTTLRILIYLVLSVIKDCQDYFVLSIHLILSNTMFWKLNGMLGTRNWNLFGNQRLYTHQHVFTHSLTHSWGTAGPCLKTLVGRNMEGVQLSPLIRAFIFTSSTGGPSQEAGAQLPRQGTDWRQASAILMAGPTWLLLHRVVTAAPAHLRARASRPKGDLTRLCSRAATLLHPLLTPAQAANPHLIRRQTK